MKGIHYRWHILKWSKEAPCVLSLGSNVIGYHHVAMAFSLHLHLQLLLILIAMENALHFK